MRKVPGVVADHLPVSVPDTVSPGRGTGHQRATGVPAGRRHALPPFPGGWGAIAGLIAFAIAVAVIGYLAIDESDDVPQGFLITTPLPAPAIVDRDDTGPQAVPPPAPAPAETSEPPDSAPARKIEPAPRRVTERPPPRAVIRKPADDTRAASPGLPARSANRAGATDARDAAPGRSVTADRAPPATPAPEAKANTQAPAPAPDRWQMMNAAVAQCKKESFFAGVICEQRVRLRYCDGYWGDVPQCPGGPRSDNRR